MILPVDLHLQVYIVTGGSELNYVIDSTEIYNTNLGSWSFGARLPRRYQSLRGTNIDGRILFFGKMILKMNKSTLRRLLSDSESSESYDRLKALD